MKPFLACFLLALMLQACASDATEQPEPAPPEPLTGPPTDEQVVEAVRAYYDGLSQLEASGEYAIAEVTVISPFSERETEAWQTQAVARGERRPVAPADTFSTAHAFVDTLHVILNISSNQWASDVSPVMSDDQ